MNIQILSIEEEFKKIIVEYFFQLTEKIINFDNASWKDISTKEIKVEKNIEGTKDLISYLVEKKANDLLIQKIKKSEKIEFNTLIDIFRFFYFNISNTDNDKPNFKLNLIDTITLELKNFINLFSNLNIETEVIDDELIQRFFENVYFFFKYLKFPFYQKSIYSDHTLKEIKMAIKCSMQINIQREDSFNLKYDLIDHNYKINNYYDYYDKTSYMEKIIKNNNKGVTNFNSSNNQFIMAMMNDEKEKLIDFNIDLIKDEIIINKNLREIKHKNKNIILDLDKKEISFNKINNSSLLSEEDNIEINLNLNLSKL